MKVIEHINSAKNPFISFEIIPPNRGGNIQSLLGIIDDLAKFDPPFIDITSHAAEVIYKESDSGIKKRTKRKRPGTLGICALIQKKYNIDAIPHILCNGFTKEETEDLLIDLQYLEIENLFAVKGDGNPKKAIDGKSVNIYASDLVSQIMDMNKGKYIDEDLEALPANFCIGVAGYPEKHFEAPNLEIDIKYIKQKVDNGAAYIVTQMFYNNSSFFEFQQKCRNAGISVPIIPGLKILTTKNHLNTLPKNFYIDLPEELTQRVIEHKDNNVTEIGVDWAYRQSIELLEKGVPYIHYYIMQSSTAINMLMKKLKI